MATIPKPDIRELGWQKNACLVVKEILPGIFEIISAGGSCQQTRILDENERRRLYDIEHATVSPNFDKNERAFVLAGSHAAFCWKGSLLHSSNGAYRVPFPTDFPDAIGSMFTVEPSGSGLILDFRQPCTTGSQRPSA
ncbi:hypothetical protein HY493_04925 [Candidatus Woesearchaeota archaeon]|nr:hypothetical protein [Candidatus Woesearchaeota archaeon]